MMKTLWLLVILGLTAPALAQHSPTVAECRSDLSRYFDELEKKGGPTVTYIDLQFYLATMDDCKSVDIRNEHTYEDMASEIIAWRAIRYEHFLERHTLMNQFINEDLAGAR